MVPALTVPLVASVAVAVFVSAVLRGFTGFGFALAATPLLTTMLAPRTAVPVVLLLQAGSSLVGLRGTIAAHDPRSTRLLAGAALLATPVGVVVLRYIAEDAARLVIALVTGAATAVLAAGVRRVRPHGAGFVLPFGLLAGLFGGLCAMPGPPVLAYYMSVAMPPAVARASMILVFLMTSVIALVVGAAMGLVGADGLRLALIGAPAMVVGTWAGSRLFHHAPAGVYRPLGLVALGLIAATATVRALTS